MAGGNDSDTKTTTQPWGTQQPYLADLFAQAANQYYNAYGNTNMPSQQVSPNANIQQGWQGTLDYANTTGRGVTQQGMGGWGQLLNSMDVANNPLVQSQITQSNRQIADDFNRQIMPSIQGDFFGAGQTGSSRQGVAEGLAAGEASKAMSNNATNIMANAYQTGSGNVQAAVGQLPQMYQAGNMAALTQGAVGQNQANWDQAMLQDQYNQWAYGQNRPWELLSMYQGLVGGNYGGTAKSS